MRPGRGAAQAPYIGLSRRSRKLLKMAFELSQPESTVRTSLAGTDTFSGAT
jgi:hypothetical protein